MVHARLIGRGRDSRASASGRRHRTAFDFRDRWNAFWLPVGPPHALGIFRALFGTAWLVRLLTWLPHVELYFSRDGIVFPQFQYSGRLTGISDLIGRLTHAPSTSIAWLIYAAAVATTIGVVLGLWTRVAVVGHLIFVSYYYVLYLHMYGTSYDRLYVLLSLILCLSPCGHALSVDAFRRARSGHPPHAIVPLWSQRLICFQIGLLYFGTGMHKVFSPAWTNGENLATSFYGDYATRLGFFVAGLGIPAVVYDAATVAVKVFEVSMILLLFSKRWQKLAFVLGAAFHLANASLLWIPQFIPVIFTYILFVDPEVVQRKASSISHRLELRRSPASIKLAIES